MLPPSPQNKHVPGDDAEPVPKPSDPEKRRVYDWRMEMFRDLGFNELQSEALTGSDADWHYVKDLLDRGASLEEALDLST